MANKTQSTRQKMTFRLAPSKPRNPLVSIARNKAAGAHRKTAKAERAAQRVAIQKLTRKEGEE